MSNPLEPCPAGDADSRVREADDLVLDAEGDDEDDDEHYDHLYLKYCFEGAASIAELSTSLRLLADDLDRRAVEGWSLAEPVDDGHAHLTRTPVLGER